MGGVSAVAWELETTDPHEGTRVVTRHATYDDLLSHIRATYDQQGRYADEGSGSMQNYLAMDGYQFDCREIKP